MKRALAALITLLVLGGALWWSTGSPLPTTPAAETPEDCVQRAFAAAETGNVTEYLDCFAGEERQRLERELLGRSRDEFARSLRQTLQDMKGRAVFAATPEDRASADARLVVERIYLNRTERQVYRLSKLTDRWRINSVERSQAYQPAKAYGTPVFEE